MRIVSYAGGSNGGRVVGGNQDYKIINVQLMSNYMVINVGRRHVGERGNLVLLRDENIVVRVYFCSQRCERLFTAV